MSICLGNKMLVEDYEISPKFKRMKLSNDNDPDYEVFRTNYIEADLQKEMKVTFPYLSEEKIKEILTKSENNAEKAKRMVHELNEAEAKKNKDFVNFHTVNRKRRFGDINNDTVFPGGNAEQIFNSNRQGNMRRPVSIIPVNNNSSSEEDLELENIMNCITSLKSKEEVKDYLKKTFDTVIKEKIKAQSLQIQNEENIQNQIKDQEIKKINENLITDNENLKKAVVTLYRRLEADRKVKDENSQLRKQIDILQNEVLKERSKNSTIALILRQIDNSTHIQIEDTENIC